jgi:hypothetical protein
VRLGTPAPRTRWCATNTQAGYQFSSGPREKRHRQSMSKCRRTKKMRESNIDCFLRRAKNAVVYFFDWRAAYFSPTIGSCFVRPAIFSANAAGPELRFYPVQRRRLIGTLPSRRCIVAAKNFLQRRTFQFHLSDRALFPNTSEVDAHSGRSHSRGNKRTKSRVPCSTPPGRPRTEGPAW